MKRTDITVALAIASCLIYTAIALIFAWNEKEIPDVLTATFLGTMGGELAASAYIYKVKKKLKTEELKEKIELMTDSGVQPENKDFKPETENDYYYTGDDSYG